mgnify:CR=1 FL=1
MKKTLVLLILDGWGIGRDDESNPLYVVKPENFQFLKENYPATSLQASGISVGLPWGEVGNSEVGHLTIGAGKVLYQYFPRLTLAVRDGTFFENKAIKDAFLHAKKNSSAVNLLGLLSKGNVHASLEHLEALINMGEKEQVPVKLHLFSDGKDSPPQTLESFLRAIPKEKIATLVGRYYAMDREGNWSLTQKAYEAITNEGEIRTQNITELPAIIEAHYKQGTTEEFLPPVRFMKEGVVRDNESILFFNFREDSIRQLAEAFIVPSFDKFPTKKLTNVYIATMTHYEDRFTVPVAYPPEKVVQPLGRVVSEAGKTQLRVAESYKYAHVTYFFNGYEEPPFKNEYRVLIPSLSTPKVYEHPQMMAPAITDRILQAIENQSFDFILANYANPDTIAHTGNYDATIEAVKAIDKEIGRIIKGIENTETILVITSDHGNAEELLNPMTGSSETQHDPNPVPFHVIAPEFKNKKFYNQNNIRQPIGILADIAPTILTLMEIPVPKEMTGRNLLRDLL